MKRTIIIAITLIIASLLFTSCQKAKEPESTKQTQVQKEKVKQQPLETINVKHTPEEGLRIEPKKMEKKLYDLEPLKKLPEADLLKKWDVLYKKFQNRTATEADKNELLKINYFSIITHNGHDAEDQKWINEGIDALGEEYLKDKILRPKAIEILIDVLLYHPSVAGRAYAAEALTKSSLIIAKEKEIVDALKEAIKDHDPEVKISSAHALMTWGETDIALPVLDEGAKAGNTWALAYLFKADGTLWDKRGKDILIQALDYPNDEVKMVAAADLAKRGWEKEKAEKKAFAILEKLIHKTEKNYGIGREKIPNETYSKTYVLPEFKGKDLKGLEALYHRDGRACHFAMWVLGEVRSKEAIPLLKEVKEKHTDVGWVCWEDRVNSSAATALKKIVGGGDR